MVLTFHDSTPLELECGATLPELDIAYNIYGSGSDVIWVCHALTANSDVADWWPHTVEPGRFLDPKKYRIVCANILGSHYGTTGPLSVNLVTGQPYFDSFPEITVRDMVRSHQRLAAHLGIDHVELLIGSSLGGFQSMEWALMQPDFAKRVALIATSAYTTPWAAGFNESQRLAIEADPTYGSNSPEAGLRGMRAARSIALLSYRGPAAYNLTQADAEERPTLSYRRVHSYQQHQGDKLCSRFNAYSYVRLSRAVDAHDVGRGRGGLKAALASLKPRALVVGITSDILFTVEDASFLADNIPRAELRTIESDFGHDGFLVEHDKLNAIITDFMQK